MKKSQVSIEYLMVIGIVLVLLLIVFSFFSLKAMNSLKQSEASEAISSIARTVDFIYAMGPGSEIYVNIKMPGGVEEAGFNEEDNEIFLKLKIYGGVADVFDEVDASDVQASIPIEKGLHKVKIKHHELGKIEIGG